MPAVTQSNTRAVALCAHCGNPVPPHRGTRFCCGGCETVYEILSSSGLGKYYELRSRTSPGAQWQPAPEARDSYAYLDDPEFRSRFSDGVGMSFFLEGVHCAACLWLIERLPRLAPGVERAELDFGRAVVRVTLKPGASFAEAARALERVGYRPHPVDSDARSEELARRENRLGLIRIGVAGACTGNIMLMATSLYGGATGPLAETFRWVSLGFFAPVALFSAVPFYRSALAALRSRTLSIDVPIVLALVLGTLLSVAHLASGSEHIYFDSLSALVFLLLSSRYLLRRIQQRALSSSHLFHFLAPSRALKLDPASGLANEVSTRSLRPGDQVIVKAGAAVPADGLVRRGTSALNCALLTGESAPVPVAPGDRVLSGTTNEDSELVVEVTAAGAETRLGAILKQVESGTLSKAPVVEAADRVARYFLAAVLAGAGLVFWLSPNAAEGLNRALALIIVTCPCALALATPLALSFALGRAAQRGILVRGTDALERLSRARTLLLDKTGTLTYGQFEVLDWENLTGHDALAEALALESHSRHPIARALQLYGQSRFDGQVPEVADFREQPGRGVEGRIGGHLFEIRAISAQTASTTIGVYRDGICIARGRLGDRLRAETPESLSRLRALGLEPYIVSGDARGPVLETALRLGIPAEHAFFGADPEEKKRIAARFPMAFMVGDGANDALALSTAFVSAAVHGSMEVSLRAADVYLSRPGLEPVVTLVGLARETMRVIRRNFAFSLLYNVAGATAAITGHMTPLLAAVLMPLSAFTVFASSIWRRPA